MAVWIIFGFDSLYPDDTILHTHYGILTIMSEIDPLQHKHKQICYHVITRVGIRNTAHHRKKNLHSAILASMSFRYQLLIDIDYSLEAGSHYCNSAQASTSIQMAQTEFFSTLMDAKYHKVYKRDLLIKHNYDQKQT